MSLHYRVYVNCVFTYICFSLFSLIYRIGDIDVFVRPFFGHLVGLPNICLMWTLVYNFVSDRFFKLIT